MSEARDLRLRAPDLDGGALADRAYDELRAAICDFRLAPNERLVQNALADQLGISRTPVRDALLRLAQEGLVRAAPWRGGYLVSEFTEHEIVEIYEVRLALEPLAVEHAAGHHSSIQIATLRHVNERIAQASIDSVVEHYELNLRFHQLVVEPARNTIMQRMLDQLWLMPSSLRMYHYQVESGESVQAMAAEHDEIVTALELSDGGVAAEAVRRHIDRARRAALERFQRQAA